MVGPFHLSIGVISIEKSIEFFQKSLKAKVTHQESSYVNIEVFGHQITLKPNPTIQMSLPDFHFGFNMSLEEFDSIATELQNSEASSFIQAQPKVVDGGTSMERKKMYLRSPTGYLVELKGYKS